jgi:type IV pilus assembly protein PilA
MKKSAQKGFTLIELMIVVAIIGILAAVALPAYQNYSTRGKLAEMVVTMSAAKVDLYEAYVADGSMPAATTGLVTDLIASIDDKKSLKSAVYTRTSDTIATLNVELENISGGINGEKVTWTFEAKRNAGGTELGLNVTCAVDTQASWTNAQLPPICRF